MTYEINFKRRSKIEISDALHTLCPGSTWSVEDTYESIKNFKSDDYHLPSKQSVLVEVERLQSIADSHQYHRLREKEYPDFRDYLDGIVKGDQEQMQAYIDKCLEVKTKYPKPE